MRTAELIRFTAVSIAAHRLRSGLTMLGIVIGVASVILLTSIGEGTRRYIATEFMQFGTNIIGIQPGKIMTSGPVGAMGGSTSPLTLDDAEVLRRIPGVLHCVPIMFGTAEVKAGERARSVMVYGVNHEMPHMMKMAVRQGRFLPEGDLDRAPAVAVIGPGLKRELFGNANALGARVRIGAERFLVIGVMEPKGYMMGFDLDDIAYIPVARAAPLFNRRDLMEIDIIASNFSSVDRVVADVKRVLAARHRGEEDFTIVTQTEMLSTLDKVINVVSAAVGGIGAISLLVGAIGILTMMWIAVNERTAEIGLLKAIGASSGQILVIFLFEAILLSTLGGFVGLGLGMGAAAVIRLAIPALPLATPPEYAAAAILVSIVVGVLSGVLPARRAARLDPIEALGAE
jgi:putative ABC transport system permease protein